MIRVIVIAIAVVGSLGAAAFGARWLAFVLIALDSFVLVAVGLFVLWWQIEEDPFSFGSPCTNCSSIALAFGMTVLLMVVPAFVVAIGRLVREKSGDEAPGHRDRWRGEAPSSTGTLPVLPS